MTSLADAALGYARRGVHVFPLAPRSKRPLIAGGGGYLGATTDAAQVRAWWEREPRANIACWPGRSGFVVFDIDDPAGRDIAAELGLLTTSTLVVTTSRGEHRWYRRPDFEVGSRKVRGVLEVKCDRASAMLPPSVHPSGVLYRAIGKLSEAAPLPPSAEAALCEAQELDTPTSQFGDLALRSPGDVDARVRAYLGTVGARGEGDRNATAFRVAAWLVTDLALEPERAWTYLQEWNVGNAPPLAQRELVMCLRSALKHARRPRGCALRQEPSARRRSHFGRRVAFGPKRFGRSSA